MGYVWRGRGEEKRRRVDPYLNFLFVPSRARREGGKKGKSPTLHWKISVSARAPIYKEEGGEKKKKSMFPFFRLFPPQTRVIAARAGKQGGEKKGKKKKKRLFFSLRRIVSSVRARRKKRPRLKFFWGLASKFVLSSIVLFRWRCAKQK